MGVKRIITCSPLPPPYGGITNWYEIVRNEARNNEIEFLNVNTSPKVLRIKRSNFSRIIFQGLKMLSNLKELSSLIKDNKDVSVAHIATSGGLGIIRDIAFMKKLKRHGVKVVYHLHFGRIPEVFEHKGVEYKRFLKAASYADAIIAIDPSTYEILKKHCKDKKVYYIANPVKQFVLNHDKDYVKKQIVYLGMVYKEKGIEELLSSWTQLSVKYPEWRLLVVGRCEPNYQKYLMDNFSMNGVEFTGHMEHDDALSVLSQSKFLVLPSYTEGFPNVIIEAMMCQKAVIATDVGANADILSDGCGIVVGRKNTEALKLAIEKLICEKSTRIELGKRGRDKAESAYNSNKIFNDYKQVWKELCEL